MGLALLCPGQGAQHAGMFAMLTNDPAARRVIDVGSTMIGDDLAHLESSTLVGRLFDNVLAQPLICTATLAAWHALRDRVATPLLAAGYSVGELAAWGCAGVLAPDALITLARERARLMDACAGAAGGMLALRGLRQTDVEALCEARACEIAIVNGEDHVVLGGTTEALEAVAADATRCGAKTVRPLAVSVISHTSRLADAAVALRERLASEAGTHASFPVLAGIDGSALFGWPQAIAPVAAQLRQTIRWSTCMAAALERGVRVFFELGPGNALSRMLQETHPSVPARSLADFRSIDGAAAWINRQLDDG